ncbi:hypothetical protein ACFYZE_13740 [Streptomyces sp. NPDC001796]|uniref:hypothetical protein n=1 Tax=Streptomyces sp. NPDC001796 TaxID=3364609 RepID=UPI0036CBF317
MTATSTRGGVVTRPVRGLAPSRRAPARRAGDRRPLVRDYLRAAGQVVQAAR